MEIYRYISLSKIEYRLPVVLLMALLAVHVASGESDKQSLHRDDPPPSDANPQDRLVQPGDKPTSIKELTPTRQLTPLDKPQLKDQKSPPTGGHSDQSLMSLIDSLQRKIYRMGEQVIQLEDALARSEADNSRLRRQANMCKDIRAMTDDAKPEGMSNATMLEKYGKPVMLNKSLSKYDAHEAEATNYSEHNLTNIKDGSRRRRDTEAECLEDQYWDGDKCTACFCSAGQQSTAKICGYGVIVGEPACEPCPNGTHHSGKLDEGIHCHLCKTCDPDAAVVSDCTKTEDTVCACKAGFGEIGGHCVSCRDHPNAEGCPPVTTPGIPPETFPEPCPEPSCPEIPEGCSCVRWKAELIGLACCILCVFISLPVGMCIQHIRQNGERETSLRMRNRTRHAANAHAGAGDDDAEHPPTENRESVANGEANGLLAANGGGVAN